LDIVLNYPIFGGQPAGCGIISGGTGPYTLYVWYNPGTPFNAAAVDVSGPQPTIANAVLAIDFDFAVDAVIPVDSVLCCASIPNGNYWVLVVDQNLCWDFEDFSVNANPALNVSANITHVQCNGFSNGAIDISVGGAQAPYTYNWSTGATTQDISGLTVGTYSVEIHDAGACVRQHTFTVGQTDPIEVEIDLVYPPCGGQPSGCAHITGGSEPYQLWLFFEPLNPDIIVLPPAPVLDLTTNPPTLGTLVRDTAILPPVLDDDSVICGSNLPAGRYWLVVVDINECYNLTDFTVEENPFFALSAEITDVSCNGGSDGAIDLSVVGGAEPYVYAWSNGATTEDIDNLTAGDYTVTVTDGADLCTATETYTVSEPDALFVNFNINYPDCGGQPSGCAQIGGGTTPFKIYVYYTPNPLIAPIITDVQNDPPITDVAIFDPTIIFAEEANSDTSLCANNIPNGIYWVVVVDQNFCYIIEQLVIDADPPITPSATVTDVSCNGGNNGAIDLAVTGGFPPYTYLWSNVATTQDIANLTAGDYSVNVEDVTGCDIDATYCVGQPRTLDLAITLDYPDCGGLPYGCAIISGGTAPYELFVVYDPGTDINTATIDFNTNPPNIDNAVHAVGLDFIPDPFTPFDSILCRANVPNGNYWVLVVDEHLCWDLEDFSVNANPPLDVVATVNNVSCHGASDGSIDLTASGAQPPYTFSWSNGETGPAISSLAPGNYTVTISDAASCVFTETYHISQPRPLNLAIVLEEPACGGQPDGCAIISGGTGPYDIYVYFDPGSDILIAAVDVNAPVPNVANAVQVTSFDFVRDVIVPVDSVLCGENLPNGDYWVLVVDQNLCWELEDFSINANPPLNVTAVVNNVSCHGEWDGSIDLTVSGAQPPYTYLWNNGRTSPNINGLPAGNYTVQIQDAGNCTFTETYHISQPRPLNLAIVLEEPACGGQPDGCAIISGGTGPYDIYVYFDPGTDILVAPVDVNAPVPNVANAIQVTSFDFVRDVIVPVDSVLCGENLPNGDYWVLVVDQNLCWELEDFSINANPPLNVTEVITNVSCHGESDGSIALTVTGAQPPYTYLWNNGRTSPSITDLSAGNYTVTISDAANCVFTETYHISQPRPLNLAIVIEEPACGGQPDGCAIISGGTGPYDIYVYFDPGTDILIAPVDLNTPVPDVANAVPVTSFDFVRDVIVPVDSVLCGENLPNGDYWVLVVDQNLCWDLEDFSINADPEVSLSANVTNASCNNCQDGAIDLTVHNGQAPIVYVWSNGETTEDIDNLNPGDYTVSMTDVNGCQLLETYVVESPVICVLPISVSVTNIEATIAQVVFGSSGADSYSVRYRELGAPDNDLQWLATTSNSRWLTGLLPATDYEVQVRSNCILGNSDWSSFTQFTTLSACDVPVNLSVPAVYGDFAKLDWDNATGAIYYLVKYRVNNSGDGWTWKLATNSQKWLVPLLPNTEYEFEARTVCNDLNTAWSATEYFTTLACGRTILIDHTDVNVDYARITWTAVDAAIKHKIQYRVQGTSIWSTLFTANASSRWIVGLLPGTIYEYRMKTRCSYGWSSFTDVRTFQTLSPRLGEQDGIELRLYPNPATEFLYVSFSSGMSDGLFARVYDVYGKLAYERQLFEKVGVVEIPVSALQPGYYMVEIGNSMERKTKRFLRIN
jgi:hypothetical protein